jgi:hypothetical protein
VEAFGLMTAERSENFQTTCKHACQGPCPRMTVS